MNWNGLSICMKTTRGFDTNSGNILKSDWRRTRFWGLFEAHLAHVNSQQSTECSGWMMNDKNESAQPVPSLALWRGIPRRHHECYGCIKMPPLLSGTALYLDNQGSRMIASEKMRLEAFKRSSLQATRRSVQCGSGVWDFSLQLNSFHLRSSDLSYSRLWRSELKFKLKFVASK